RGAAVAAAVLAARARGICAALVVRIGADGEGRAGAVHARAAWNFGLERAGLTRAAARLVAAQVAGAAFVHADAAHAPAIVALALLAVREIRLAGAGIGADGVAVVAGDAVVVAVAVGHALLALAQVAGRAGHGGGLYAGAGAVAKARRVGGRAALGDARTL